MSETVIKVNNLKKRYRLGLIGGGTLTADLQSWWARKRGKEDPNTMIGENRGERGDSFMALKGISFEVRKGEALGIIGGNGAGKSTLLKILSRVTAPTDGEIYIKGRISSMLEVGTGFHGELTGRENIYLNGAILGMSKAEVDAKIEDIIEFSECRKFIDTPVKRYSSGMYVKLAFAVAAHLDSEIMIMDEVLAVGDMKFQEKCLGKMGDATNNEGKTVLYVSHNMNTIRQLCNRCIVLEQGVIIYDGDVEEAIALYLNNANEEASIFADLRDRARPENSTNKAYLYSMQILERKECILSSGEKLKFKLQWEARENIENAKCRLTVRDKYDVPVGLAQSSSLGNYKEGDIQEHSFEFDTKGLVAGKYFINIALYQSDRIGNSIVLDHVSHACSFEIIDSLEKDNILKWDSRWWGSISFPELRISE